MPRDVAAGNAGALENEVDDSQVDANDFDGIVQVSTDLTAAVYGDGTTTTNSTGTNVRGETSVSSLIQPVVDFADVGETVGVTHNGGLSLGTASLEITTDGLTLTGLGDIPPALAQDGNDIVVVSGASGVTISGFEIVQQFGDQRDRGVSVRNGASVTITNPVFRDLDGAVQTLGGGNQVTVENIEVYSSTNTSVLSEDPGSYTVEDVTIESNTIEGDDVHIDDQPDDLDLQAVLGNNTFNPSAANVGDQLIPETAPTEVTDWTDLNDVRNDMDGNYVLTTDLNQNTAGYDTVVDTANGFDTIGSDGNEFTGAFLGDGYEISDLVIDRDTETGVGLFGATEGAFLNNLGLSNATVIGDNVVAGLAARNGNTTIANVYVNGTIVANTSSVGGIAGDLNGGSITESFSAGTVDGENASSVGGIVGIANSGDVFNSYSLSNVTGKDFVGGVAGKMNTEQRFENPDAIVDRSYAAGNVAATGTQVAGLIGQMSGTSGDITANLTNSYWDNESTGQVDAVGNVPLGLGFTTVIENNTGLTTSEMQGSSAETNMDNLSFAGTWETVEDSQGDTTGDGYPILQVLDRDAQLSAQELSP